MTLILVFTDDTEKHSCLLVYTCRFDHSSHSQKSFVFTELFTVLMRTTSARLDNCAFISQLVVYLMLINNHSNNCSNIYLVTPEKVKKPTPYRKDTDIIQTTWTFPMDTGSCAVEYEIEFFDADNKTVFKQGRIVQNDYTKTFLSNKQRDSVKIIKVRATYLGKSGDWSETTIAAATKFHGKGYMLIMSMLTKLKSLLSPSLHHIQ